MNQTVLLFVGGCAQGERRVLPAETRSYRIPVLRPIRVRSRLDEPIPVEDCIHEVHNYNRERVILPGPPNDHNMRWLLEIEVMLWDNIPPGMCHEQVRRLLPFKLQTIPEVT